MLLEDVTEQLLNRVTPSHWFAIQMDESTDVLPILRFHLPILIPPTALYPLSSKHI
jgi:hypothetical protein